MKLQHALLEYGLIPLDDYVDDKTALDFTRVNGIVRKLAVARFGENAITVVRRERESSLKWTGYGVHRNYAVDYTLRAICERGWTCGVIEAMFRRFLTGLHETDQSTTLPPAVLATIPGSLKGW